MAESTVQRRDEVLGAAEELFASRGYHAASVRDIADALNIKGGSLYAHIETKEDLLWEILVAAADRFFAAVTPIVESDLIPIEKLLGGLVLLMARTFVLNILYCSLMRALGSKYVTILGSTFDSPIFLTIICSRSLILVIFSMRFRTVSKSCMC